MNDKDFDQLVESVKQMKQIQAGKLKPAQVTGIKPINIKQIRQKLNQSQTEFAYMIGISPSTLRNWEQGLRQPEGPARALLKIAEKAPDIVFKSLHN